MTDLTEAHDHVARWIEGERAGHADVKYGPDQNLPARLTNVAEGNWDELRNFVLNYMKRVELFGLDTPQGRQALGKAAVTLIAYAEYAVAIHGPMPTPGVTSGEIQTWEAA